MLTVWLRLAVRLGNLRPRLRLAFAGGTIGLGIMTADAKRGEFLKERRTPFGFRMHRRRLAALRPDLVLRRKRQILDLRHSLRPDDRRVWDKGAWLVEVIGSCGMACRLEIRPLLWRKFLHPNPMISACGKRAKSALIVTRVILCHRLRIFLRSLQARLRGIETARRRLGPQPARNLGNTRLGGCGFRNARRLVDSGCDDRDADDAVEILVESRA
jgi:hypothetical protein